MNPDRVAVTSDLGWDGATRNPTIDGTFEATLVARLSVVASTAYGDTDTRARPSIGAAYQILDPRHGLTGLRVSLAYKPEGFTEPDGEIESVAILSRRLGDDALRGMAAYGRDPDGGDSDAELGASYLHRTASWLLLGGLAHYRRGISVSTTSDEPRWDLFTAGIGSARFGSVRVEIAIGSESIAYASPHTGAMGLVSVGADL